MREKKERKKMNKLSKRAISLLVIATFLLSMIPIMPASAATITVAPSGADHTTIQDAIDAASAGDVITVAAGIYTLDLDIPVALTGLELSGATGAIIVGVSNVVGSIRIFADGVKIHGFTIRGPTLTGTDVSNGVQVGASDVEIYDNDFEVSESADLSALSVGIQSLHWGALAGVDVDGLNIHDNTFTGVGSGLWYEAIYINRDVGTGTVTIADNTISGLVRRGIATERSNTVISGNVISTTMSGTWSAINIMDYAGPEDIDSVTVSENTISGGFREAIRIGQDNTDEVTNIEISRNTLDGNIIGVLVRSSPEGVTINYNQILNSGTWGVENEIAEDLDATMNYWGTLVESEILALITGTGAANVDYDPWALQVDKGDTLTIAGSGVSSGSLVEAFWDTAAGAGADLLNTTTGNPDGTYDLEITIPSSVEGPHYIWIKDSLNPPVLHTIVLVIPKFSLSPDSGLFDDEVVTKGYGYTAESDVTIIWDSEGSPSTLTDSVETDEDGYFTYTFDVPTANYGDYNVTATDSEGYTAYDTYTVGASLTLDIEEGPEGTKVEVSGTGFLTGQEIGPDEVIWDGTALGTLVGDNVTVPASGEFTLEIVVPSSGEGEYTLMIEDETETTDVEADFEIDGAASISVSPTYGAPGASITVTGANFTQIAGTEILLTLSTTPTATPLGDVETNADGTFETTFVSPAVEFETYDVLADDALYSTSATDAFKVGMIALIINPTSGESGTLVGLTGVGFTYGDFNMTFGVKLYEYANGVDINEIIAETFYAPNVAPGTYSVTVVDEDENELTATFIVTESTIASVDPVVAPTGYNVTLSGNNFGDAVGPVDFVIYNSTDEWPMEVLTDTGPSEAPTATDTDGNFTGWWEVEADLSNGAYTINVTGDQGLLVQLDFSAVSARVSVAPRKATFDRGDTVSFDISNDFALDDSYIEIYSPDDALYWLTDDFDVNAGMWIQGADDLYTVPKYLQTANLNQMELASDAPMGTWTYFFYDNADDELMNGTFIVGPSTSAQIDEMMTEVQGDIADLASDLAGITDDVEDDIAALSTEIAGVASDLSNLADDIVSDLASDIADATDAGNAALGAVEDLANSMSDLGDAVSDIADIASDSADASQSAADAANDAVAAAEEAQKSASGLTTLVYGAIGASLIAALAAIVSLMQISKRIAG